MIIGVFTSRITLEALGVDNYGTVNVVAGFVSMFTLISAALTSTCQRFITFELGSKDGNVHEIFNTSVHIHIFFSIIVILFAETIGLYFVNHQLNIPTDIRPYVQWVYQCSIAGFVLSLLNVPYNAIIVAYEKFNIFAIISILESVLKLGVVLCLLYLPGNKLVIYSILGLCSSIIIRACFQTYTRYKFKNEVKLQKKINRKLTKKIFGFAGWSFIGNTAMILSNQGVNIVLNIFCGVVVNAARGIAAMVESVITVFVNNFTTALNPQITKAYASQNSSQLKELVSLGMRISFFLMLILAVPICISAKELLQIWFVKVPEYTVIFVRLTLIVAVVQALGNPFLTVMLATGKIRTYQIVVGGITLMNLPLSYIALKLGYSPIMVYLIAIGIVLITFSTRLIFIKNLTSISLKPYLNLILLRFIPIFITGGFSAYFLHSFISIHNIWLLGIYLATAAICIGLIVYFFGLNPNERKLTLNYFKTKVGKG